MRTSQLVAIFSILIATSVMHSQTATGVPPFSSTTGGPDIINLGNLNSHLCVPIVNKPGRGIPFTYSLCFDNSIWYPVGSSGSQSWQPVQNWGWQGQTSAMVGYLARQSTSGTCQYGYQGQSIAHFTVNIWVAYVDQSGTSHPFPQIITVTNDGPCGPQQSGYQSSGTATDSSGIHLDAIAGKVTFNSGATDTPPVQSVTGAGVASDSNGNQISTPGNGSFIDTLGTTALTISGTAPSDTTYQYTDSNGAPQHVTVSYLPATVQTNFACGFAQYGPTSSYLISQVKYPDNSSYQFTYEPTSSGSSNVTGRLKTVTLPTGGAITYDYSGSIECVDGSTASLTRTTPDGQLTYSRANPGGTAWTTTIQSPLSDKTVINFQQSGNNFYETSRTSYQGQNGLLQTVYTCYNGLVPNCDATAVALPISERDVFTVLGSVENRVDTFYNGAFAGSGLVNETDEYDYGSGAPGPLLRKTLITYAANEPPDRVASVTIQDGGGNQKALTTYGYDAPSPGLTTTSGVPQHIAATGPRGNLTSIGQWLNTTGGTLPTILTYEDTGNVLTSTDPGGHQTQFSYADSFAGGQTPNAHAYVTTVTMQNTGVPHITTAKYDINTGLVTSSTDQNGNATNFTYDSMLRPLAVVYPVTDGSGNHAETDYVYPGATTIQVKQRQDASTWINQYAYLDGLGRVYQTRLSDPEGDDLVDTTYDADGRVHSVSNPYRSTSDPTYGVTTNSYDALGRVTQTTDADGNASVTSYSGNCSVITDEASRSRQVCVDGLGRVTLVTEANPVNGSLVFGAASTSHSYSGFTVSINQAGDRSQSARTRVFTYDSLSRLVSAYNPESGTTTYGYAADTTCNPDGLLRTRTDARNVTTTYCYDKLHRTTQKSYSDGSTPGAHFVYDTDPGWGVSVTNPVGRMTKTYTDASVAAEIFGYDAMGRVVLNNQCTPFNCGSGSWPVSYTYDLGGEPDVLHNWSWYHFQPIIRFCRPHLAAFQQLRRFATSSHSDNHGRSGRLLLHGRHQKNDTW